MTRAQKYLRFNGVNETLEFWSHNIDSQPLRNFIREWINSDDFIEVKTSGSTGKPKNIRIFKKSVEESALKTINYFELKRQKFLLCLPVEFIAGKLMVI